MAEESAQSLAPAPQDGEVARPIFRPLRPDELSNGEVQFMTVRVPQNRYSAVKKAWLSNPPNEYDIYHLVHDKMKIDICMRPKKRLVIIKTCPDTPDISLLQKCREFLAAFMLGFDSQDAAALCRYDGIYIDGFNTDDVKVLRGEHLKRAIGRMSGTGGRTKNAIENATNTRIVIADKQIHLLGKYENIKVARRALSCLILGSPAGKVYSDLRAISARLQESG